MTAHTQGEWFVVKPKNPDIRQVEDRLICATGNGGKLHIAEVYQYQNDNNREVNGTALANARLIAAAPDLLAACKRNLNTFIEISKLVGDWNIKKVADVTGNIEQLRSAISLAGEVK